MLTVQYTWGNCGPLPQTPPLLGLGPSSSNSHHSAPRHGWLRNAALLRCGLGIVTYKWVLGALNECYSSSSPTILTQPHLPHTIYTLVQHEVTLSHDYQIDISTLTAQKVKSSVKIALWTKVTPRCESIPYAIYGYLKGEMYVVLGSKTSIPWPLSGFDCYGLFIKI